MGGEVDFEAGTDMTRGSSENARQDTVCILGTTVIQTSTARAVWKPVTYYGKCDLFPEMIIARMRELHHVPVPQNERPGRVPHLSDGTIAPSLGG